MADLPDGVADAIEGAEFAICVADFYDDIALRLANSAVEAFDEAGISPPRCTSTACRAPSSSRSRRSSAPRPAASPASPASAR